MRKIYSLKAQTIHSNSCATARGSKSSHHAAPAGNNRPIPAVIAFAASKAKPTYTAPLEMGTATRLEIKKLNGN